MNLNEYLQDQLNVPLVAKLGASLGLKATQSTRIADGVLPDQLNALQALARTPQGSQRLLDLARDRLPAGSVKDLTQSPEALTRLQRVGTGLLTEVMPTDLEPEVQRLATATGVDAPRVQSMMALLLPLLLRLIAGQANRQQLSAVTLGTLFTGAAVVTATAASVAGAATAPTVVVEHETSVSAAPQTTARPAEEQRRRRGVGWWWLLPLLLLLGVGGCFLIRSQGGVLTLNQPTAGATVSGPVTISGTGQAGATVTVSENGAPLTTAQVNQDGTFSAAVPVYAAGEHTYTVSESGTQTTLTRTVTASAPTTDTAQTSPATSAAAGILAITRPAAAATVPAGSLTLSGTGPANTSLTLSEDGNNLGQAQTDASGAWTFAVPSPAPGAHTYTASAGTETSQLALTVAAGTAQTAPCTKTFSLSLKDGQQVRGPFRFGGVGRGKNYTVTVLRGTRQIGQKVLPLDSTCGWSYTSRPGMGRVTYALRETGQSTVAGEITLNVTQ